MNLKPLTTAGLIGSAGWIGFVVWYLFRSNQIETVLTSAPNNFGDFWSGTFAPLAFWWLVLGYFQQGIELRQNVAALEQQSKETAALAIQAKVQAEAIKANELHTRRDVFFRSADRTIEELRETAFFILSRIEDFDDFVISNEKEELITAAKRGSKDACFIYLAKFIAENSLSLMKGYLNSRAGFNEAVDHYCSSFERLLADCENVSGESNKVFRNYYQGSNAARLYEQLCSLSQNPRQSAMRYD